MNCLLDDSKIDGTDFVIYIIVCLDSHIQGEDGDKLSLIKLARIIEVPAKKGTRDLKLQGKLIGCLIL
ncbi:hypothetical protein MTR_6g005645 [Medicago truncatula]|uniref:Uncharacterized protein n=1 Tax=Medicago truncatula TaxID=3880 RepID=A0A072U538_MEDTR|nr:hypothetical protein MTR_6g005645 [Medicago truncatula]